MVRLLLLSGADQKLVNDAGRTPLSVACCPNNPCKNPELEKVVKLLSGEIALGETDNGVTGGASKGLFKQTGTQDRVSVKIKEAESVSTMSGAGEEAGGAKEVSKEEDVYEFTTSKESTPTSSRASARYVSN